MTRVTAKLAKPMAQPVRYLAVAGGVILLYLGLYSGGVLLGVHYFFSILIAQFITISVAFPLYRTVVFDSTGRILTDFVRFLSVWTTGAIAGIVATPLLVEVARIDPITAQVMAVVVVGVGSFLAHKFFSFRGRGGSPTSPSPDKGKKL